eukprot:gene11715-12936_t
MHNRPIASIPEPSPKGENLIRNTIAGFGKTINFYTALSCYLKKRAELSACMSNGPSSAQKEHSDSIDSDQEDVDISLAIGRLSVFKEVLLSRLTLSM